MSGGVEGDAAPTSALSKDFLKQKRAPVRLESSCHLPDGESGVQSGVCLCPMAGGNGQGRHCSPTLVPSISQRCLIRKRSPGTFVKNPQGQALLSPSGMTLVPSFTQSPAWLCRCAHPSLCPHPARLLLLGEAWMVTPSSSIWPGPRDTGPVAGPQQGTWPKHGWPWQQLRNSCRKPPFCCFSLLNPEASWDSAGLSAD